MKRKSVGWPIIGVIALMLVFIGFAGLAEEGVEVRARVTGMILLTIESGDTIGFYVDPLHNPRDTAKTELSVMTNIAEYNIIATFGDFKIGDYDLIAGERFFIRVDAPGSGEGIDEWTVPEAKMVILSNEDGLTAREKIVIRFMLRIDFTVPPGEGELEVTFTAVPSL
ncbi:hypothetical protein LR032_03390 [Candidatus Bipolaricaulota bacterium]|nr:hypothetical protein [Candidatus Bipolaricaulota bacterium]